MADGFDFNFGDFNWSDAASSVSDALRGGIQGGGLGSETFSGLTAIPGSSSGGAGTDWGGLAGQIFGGIKEYGLPALRLGTAGMGLASGIRGGLQLGEQTGIARDAENRQASIAKQAQEQAASLSGFSQSQLSAAQGGTIPPAMQAQIDQWKQAAKQRVMQMAASSGQGQSSQLQAWLDWIDQQAVSMGQGALQDQIRQGIAAGGVAGNVLGTGAAAAGGSGYQAAQQQGSMQDLIAAANRALASLG